MELNKHLHRKNRPKDTCMMRYAAHHLGHNQRLTAQTPGMQIYRAYVA